MQYIPFGLEEKNIEFVDTGVIHDCFLLFWPSSTTQDIQLSRVYWIINWSQVPPPFTATTTTTTVWTTTAAPFQYLKAWKENIRYKSVITVRMSLAKIYILKARAAECEGGGGSSVWELEISAHRVCFGLTAPKMSTQFYPCGGSGPCQRQVTDAQMNMAKAVHPISCALNQNGYLFHEE